MGSRARPGLLGSKTSLTSAVRSRGIGGGCIQAFAAAQGSHSEVGDVGRGGAGHWARVGTRLLFVPWMLGREDVTDERGGGEGVDCAVLDRIGKACERVLLKGDRKDGLLTVAA